MNKLWGHDQHGLCMRGLGFQLEIWGHLCWDSEQHVNSCSHLAARAIRLAAQDQMLPALQPDPQKWPSSHLAACAQPGQCALPDRQLLLKSAMEHLLNACLVCLTHPCGRGCDGRG